MEGRILGKGFDMTNAEIEATVEVMSLKQKLWLYRYLEAQLVESQSRASSSRQHSILEISPVHLGNVLVPFTETGDLLNEMLESTR